ncbi:Cellulosome-anchoring protein precursor [Pelotomaculum schinkii]|uniref:Cellulosome-anchoring protein n=1 Tax=Pelotomaculum schinkii TaxID=78350 RepID=A0A4Y7RGW7_9FIRM|nr:S-layer homology domain-containing protein [Pelotomaculum schinkii]TEB08244.1 Cellulosome-anchoring protein precursor [Pelotomaculum schinkii]
MSHRLKLLLVFSILISIFTAVFENAPKAEAFTIPALTQDLSYPDWVNDSNNGFTITASSNARLSGDPSFIWLAGPDEGPIGAGPASLTISAGEDFAGGVFDLTAIAFDLLPGSTYNVTVTGYKASGSTVTAGVTGGSTAEFNAIDLSGMTQLTSFDVELVRTAGDDDLSYLALDSFTIVNPQLYAGNQAPTISNLSDALFQENTVNAAPQQIDADITVTDSDSADFDGGQVVVSYTAAGLPEDQLSIGNIGNISVAGSAVNHAGVGQIGTISGGTNGADLVISLNATATPARVTELLRALAYGNTFNEPASHRTISITVSDGDGGTSAAVTAKISVSGQAESGVEIPALTQDLSYPAWWDDLNNGFTIAANGSAALNGNATSIWLENGGTGPASLTIIATEQFEGGMFDLAGLVFDLAGSGNTYTVTITGHKAGGSTVTADVTGGTAAELNAIDLSGMTHIYSFDVQISGTANVYNLGLDSFTIANPQTSAGNLPPSISNLNDTAFQENTVNAAPQQIDADITVTDSDSEDFDGGQVTVSYTSAGLPEDQLSVGNIGNISVAGSAVNYAGAGQIGTMSGGANGSSLVISLNSVTTPVRVTELLRALTYRNTSDEPASYRTISVTVSDGDGGTSTAATARISVSGQAESGVDSPALTQDLSYPDWVDDLNNGFTVAANGSVTLAGDASSIWLTGGGAGPASLTITAAEQFEGGMFDLAGIVFDLYGSGNIYTATVTGHKAGGGTVTTSATGSDTVSFNAINLSGMTGLTSFDVQIVRVSGFQDVSNLGLDSFTIANPQAANLPPVFHSAASFSVPETAQADSAVLHDVQADDGDGGANDANLTYSIAGGTGQSYFAINGATGEITLSAAGAAALDYESAAGYTLTVRADDGQATNNITEQTITVNVSDVAPVVTPGQSFTVSETATDGTSVGAVVAAGDDDSVTYSIESGNTGGAFAINASTGEMTVNNSGAIDYEAAASFTLTIQATDGSNNSSQAVTVNVSDAAPVVTPGQSFTVSETAAAGTSVGAVAVTGDDDSLTFSIESGNTGGAFAINASTGEITVNNADAIDYETAASFTLTVKATDGSNNSAQTVTVDVDNVNEPPSVSAPAAVTVTEDVLSPITGISVADMDAGANNVIATFTVDFGILSAASGGGVTVGGTAAALTLTGTVADINNFISGGNLRYTTALNDTGDASLSVSVNDQGHTGPGGALESGVTNVTVHVDPVNDAPSFTKGPDQAVSANAGPQTMANWATDIIAGPADEAGQTMTFSVYSNDNPALFAVPPAVAADGTLTYTPAPGATGSATVAFCLTDDGGTANGGVDTSASQFVVFQVYAADGGGALTVFPGSVTAGQTGVTLTFTYVADAGGLNNGAITITVPDGWSVPGTDPAGAGYSTASKGSVTVAGRTITVSGLNLAGGESLTVSYGDKAMGGPGATAATTPGTVTWQAATKSTSGGTLIDLGASPAITVTNGVTDPDRSAVAAGPTTVPGDGTGVSTITVTLRDHFDNLVGGQTVELNQGSGSSVITPATAVSDQNGRAVFSVHSIRAETVTYTATDISAGVTLAQSAQVTFTGGVSVSPTGLSLTEGEHAGYSVALGSQPADTVTIHVYGGSQAAVAPASLSFNGGNWNVPQTVTVTAVDDNVNQGPRDLTVTNGVYSSDPYYSSVIADPVVVHITDNDSPAVRIVQTGGSTSVTEGGEPGKYAVVLTTRPADSVTVKVYGDSQLDLYPTEITFSPHNWSLPQEVAVTAVDNFTAEGSRSVSVTHSVYSPDPDYNGIPVQPLTIYITDNDTPAVIIGDNSGSVSVTEGGASVKYPIVLATQPSASVVVNVYGDAQVSVSPGSLTFSPNDWNVPQEVTVTAVDDNAVEGPHTGAIKHSVSSNDPDYDAIAAPDLSVSITDNDRGGSGGHVSSPSSSATGSAVIKSSVGGTVSLGNEVSVSIPAGALTGYTNVNVSIVRHDNPPPAPAGFTVLGGHYELSVNGQSHYNFNKPVTLTFIFDPAALAPGEKPEVFYYDEESAQWISLGGEVAGNTITITVDHFTLYAVMAKRAVAFADIAGHWAQENIEKLVATGAVNGYPDDTFRPDSSITRAEFVTVLVKACKLEPQQGKIFADTQEHWAKDSISTASFHGIIDGYSDEAFGPDDPVTREQAAVMVVKAAKLAAPLSNGTSFTDSAEISGWATGAVAAAVQNGVINGYPDNTFRPKADTTRAEAVTIIVKALGW